MTRLDQEAQKILKSIQDGLDWDGETRLENMIKTLEELIRKTSVNNEKHSSMSIKLKKRLLLILKTMENSGFDVHSSTLFYIVPGLHKFDFEFEGFIYDAVLNFNLVSDKDEEDYIENAEEDKKQDYKLTQCSYKFVHIDGIQQNLGQLVDKFERTKEWRNVRDEVFSKKKVHI